MEDGFVDRMQLRLYDLTHLLPPPPALGSGRLAKESDLDLLSFWSMEFGREALGETDNDLLAYKRSMAKIIAEKRQWVWAVNDDLVAMTVWTGRNELGTKITGVYTPPEHRGRGYASNLVAAVTSKILEEGSPRAFIYTDLSNPTSNSIYLRIGYRPVCDFLHSGCNAVGHSKC